MGFKTIDQLDAAVEKKEAVVNEAEVKNIFLRRHPNWDRQANWSLITKNLCGRPLTLELAERLAKENESDIAVISPEDLQAEQEEMTDTVLASRFWRKTVMERRRNNEKPVFGDFMSSEEGRLQYYEIQKGHYRRELMQLPRFDLKKVVQDERQRISIVDRIMRTCYRPFDPRVITGGRFDYEKHLAEERASWLDKPIEELLRKNAELDVADAHRDVSPQELRVEAHETYLQKHPQAVGAIPPKSHEEAREYDRRATSVEESSITYSAAELKAMPLPEYRRYFMQQGPGGWQYRPGYEAAINKILNGKESEPARIRNQFLRTHVVA